MKLEFAVAGPVSLFVDYLSDAHVYWILACVV